MSDPQLLAQMEHWGYNLVPGEPPYAPGNHSLLVALREIPTEMHFDPEVIQLRMGDAGDSMNMTTIRLHHPIYGTKQVGLGRVIINDRVDKRLEFFVYGGTLEATYGSDEGVIAIRSSAPILEITDDLLSFSDQLAFETEVIIAEAEAMWHGDDHDFAQQLAQLEPAQCYLSAVKAILQRYELNPRLRTSFHIFYAALCKEKEWLTEMGMWSDSLPHLHDLLRPQHNHEHEHKTGAHSETT